MRGLGPIPDVVGEGLRLLLVGINPGVHSARMRAHFAGPGNRFWPALHTGGLTPDLLDATRQRELVPLGMGITNLVARPSHRAGDLHRDELRRGAATLAAKVQRWEPSVVAVLGLTAYRIAFSQPAAGPGPQPGRIAGAALWLLPNPSGLNARTRLDDHAAGLRAAALAAGIAVPAASHQAAPR